MNVIKSSDFAINFNISKRTLRHYESIGLLLPEKAENGYRYYKGEDIKKMELIQSMKTIGMSLNEIKITIDSDLQMLMPTLNNRLDDVEKKIEELETAKRLLGKLINKNTMNYENAFKQSIEEDHIEWLKENLSDKQYKLLEVASTNNKIYDVHNKTLLNIGLFCDYLKISDVSNIDKIINNIKNSYANLGISNKTIRILMKLLVHSNLKGPKHSKIISKEDGEVLLSYF